MNGRLALAAAFCSFLAVATGSADIPVLMNYQGKLTDENDVPVETGNYHLCFRIYNDSAGGSLLWEECDSVRIEGGLFSTILGDMNAMDSLTFDTDYWLAMEVEGQGEVTPRQRIVSTGYAFRSLRADTADYALVPTDNDWLLVDEVLYPTGDYGLSMRQSNVFHGNNYSTHVNFGIACTTGTSGQHYAYCVTGGGVGNAAAGISATVAGGQYNRASLYSAVGGGNANDANGGVATIGGGSDNIASYDYTTVGGGYDNVASAYAATVSGGYKNIASGYMSSAAGGHADTVAGDYSFAAGQQVRVRSAAHHTFAFGRDFATSAPNAVVFHNSVDPIRVGIGTANPTYDLDVRGDDAGSEAVINVAHTDNTSADSHARLRAISGGTSGGDAYVQLTIPGATDWHVGADNDDSDKLKIGDGYPVGTGNVMTLTKDGNVGIGTTSPIARLDVNGSTGYGQLRMRTSYTPTGTSDTNGNTGDIAWDDNYIYVKTTAGWKRVALSTF